MGTSHGDFTKYPRTPHLFGSKGTDDDKHLGEAESKELIAGYSVLELPSKEAAVEWTLKFGQVVKVNEIRRDKVISVTVRIPQALDIARGDHFGLIHMDELPDGSVIPMPIGEISIDQYVSQDYWIATVKKGGDRLYALKEQLGSIRCTE